MGGDWFDVIPLAGARVALVVGDVVGHGVHAAATMGRLRTAVHNFSTLDMPPDELLGHLDELIDRIDQDESSADEGSGEGESSGVTGATCLYAVYDPVSGHCAMASAATPARRSSGPTGRWSTPSCRSGCRWASAGCPSRPWSCSCPRRAGSCCSPTGCWRTATGTSTPASTC